MLIPYLFHIASGKTIACGSSKCGVCPMFYLRSVYEGCVTICNLLRVWSVDLGLLFPFLFDMFHWTFYQGFYPCLIPCFTCCFTSYLHPSVCFIQRHLHCYLPWSTHETIKPVSHTYLVMVDYYINHQ
jgi:hypothetical protein